MPGHTQPRAGPVAPDYAAFVQEIGGRLRVALISAYGVQVGEDATAEALAYAWEHWDRVSVMENPAGYLYRVGQTRAGRGIFRRSPPLPRPRAVDSTPWVEPALAGALEELSPKQRTAVLLVHGFGWTISEVADVLGVAFSTAKVHLERGMGKLRDRLGVDVVV